MTNLYTSAGLPQESLLWPSQAQVKQSPWICLVATTLSASLVQLHVTAESVFSQWNFFLSQLQCSVEFELQLRGTIDKQYSNTNIFLTSRRKQSGAVGACWAHNPEVDGSKPSSAIFFSLLLFLFHFFFSHSFTFYAFRNFLNFFPPHILHTQSLGKAGFHLFPVGCLCGVSRV